MTVRPDWFWTASMPLFLTDDQIADLLRERKVLTDPFRGQVVLKQKQGHKEAQIDVKGQSGSGFRLIFRQADMNPLDFSIILTYKVPQSNELFTLRRYNGKSHEHTNPLEGETFYDFHIHQSTERYQEAGHQEEKYAEHTDRYADYNGALDCLIQDCGFFFESKIGHLLFDAE